MQTIIHRVNTVHGLGEIPREFGVELDIRDHDGRLVINHEPYSGGEPFEAYCRKFGHALMIVDVKSEGIEGAALGVLEKNGIDNFFFLGLSFPSVVKLADAGEMRIGLRFSEYEPIEGCLAMAGKAEWAWVDTFSRLPLDKPSFRKLKHAGFRTCLVCPERWGRPGDIPKYRKYLEENRILPDAVMTSLAHVREWG